MSEYVKLTYGSTDGSLRPASLQEVGRPASMTMQGLSPNVQYYSQAELYDGLQLVSQSLQETFRTLSAGVITLTHVSDVRSGNNYIITYSVSSTYALSSSIMSINSTNVQGQISGNTISFVVGSLTMGQTYSYSISTIDLYGETDATSGSLVTIAQNYITIEYSSRTSSSVTFDLDYVSDGGFYEGYIEYWSSEKDPSTDQADGHTFFQDGADTVTQSNLDDGTTYKFRATILQSVGGTEIQSSVVTQSTADIDHSGDYLTITSTSANNTIYFKSVVYVTTGSIDYSTDNGSTWTTVSGGTSGNGNTLATLGNGDKLILRSTRIRGGSNKLNASGSYTVSGNLASLQFGDNFNVSGQTAQSFSDFFKRTPVTSAKGLYLGAYSTMGASSFSRLFDGCTSLTTPPSSLPATTLANYCYQFMFNGCTSLTTAPSISATSVPESAFSNMFNNCSSLTTAPDLKQVTSVGTSGMLNMFYGCSNLTQAPALPATTLANYCYNGMFHNCTSLTTAPALPATTLAECCYNTMFYGCSNLTQAPALPATTLAADCYGYMFGNCTSITAAPSLPVTTLENNCYRGMFQDCTSLTAAPSLPATTLADGCYQYMFYGCTSMAAAPALPATTLAPYCYQYMFSDCTITSAPALPVTTLAEFCYAYMFNRCTALTTAPALPATSLPLGAYSNMFNGCTSLTTAPDLRHVTNVTTVENGYKTMVNMYYGCSSLTTAYAPTITWNATNKTTDWLYGVANSGTLYADSTTAASIPTSSASGCPIGWRINVPDAQPTDYFTITNQTNTTNTISAVWQNSYGWKAQTFEVSTDGTNWNQVTATTAGATLATLPAFGSVKVRHTGTMQGNSFRGTGSHSVGGNIASLDLGSAYNVTERTMATSQFEQIFKNDTYLINAANLYFGAYSTTGTNSCKSMFESCSSLVTPPSLPATTLANSCYLSMFNGCTSLTTAPSISATSVPESAFSNMFNNCSSLTTAPDLKQVTSVGTSGMLNMYYRCSSLTTAYAPTVSTWSETNMSQWLRDVAASGAIHANATVASIIPPLTYNGCPEGWYVVVDNAQDVEWFTIKNEYAGDTTLTIKATQSGKEQTVDVSTDGTNWTSVTSTTSGVTLATIPQNGSVKLRHTGALGYNTITGDHEHSLQGNAISIDLGDVKKVLYRKTPDDMFCKLFSGDSKLISCRVDFDSYAAGGYRGMYEMFQNCTSLASMSNLNSFIKVYDSVWANAFDRCSSLTTPPTFNNLTTIQRNVFYYAFQNSGLTVGVDLSGITSNWENAYEGMYIGCTSLTDAGKLPQSIGGWNACCRMYSGCTSLTTPPDASHLTTLNTITFKCAFIGCTALEHGLDLSNVTTANNNSLQEAYQGCRSLQYVTAPSIGTWNEAYTTKWLSNVSASGTIYADSATAATITSDSTSGCPSGWNVVVA